ncbi:hypothetical protein [Photobacterium damselae]|uniref:hypothetical protein n=1 Tax=Photobacterium damselae TaxID=38293 RepID=UPI0018A4A1FF|nr:hypothetical protein [Photobacterium damselae]QOQ69871.1 hypothetical protein IL982_06235 [Photobacterium damselae subsp. damselae]
MKKNIIALLFMFCIPSWAESLPLPESMSVEDAYQLGDLLVEQYKIKQGQPYLKYAADKGNAEAALAYSRSLSTNVMVLGPQEQNMNMQLKPLSSEMKMQC